MLTFRQLLQQNSKLTPEQIEQKRKENENREAEKSACANIIDSFFKYNSDGISWISICLFAAYNNCLRISLKDENVSGICIYDNENGQRIYLAEDIHFDENIYNEFVIELKTYVLSHHFSLNSVALDVAKFFVEKDAEWFRNHSLFAFKHILSKCNNSKVLSHERDYPFDDITELIDNVLCPEKGSTLFNPYAELGTFVLKSARHLDYEAQEQSEDNWVLANLNLYFNGYKPICQKADSSKNWPEKVFDYIVSVPPLGVQVINKKGEKTTSEIDFLQHAINGYSRKFVCVLSACICNINNEQLFNIRKELVDNDQLEAVILLPKNALRNTAIKTVVLIANLEKEKKGIVRFVDASDYDIDRAYDFYHSEEPIDEMIDVSIKEIADNSYNIFPPYYLNEEIQSVSPGMKIVSLRDILTPLKADVCYEVDDMRYVGIEDVNNSLSGIINAEDMPLLMADDSNKRHQYIDQSCLVVIFSTRFHIGYLKMETSIEVMLPYLSKVFDVRKDSVDPAYLVSEMRKPYFTKQLSRFTAGTTFNRVKADELLSCKIIVPSNVQTQAALALKEQAELLKKKGIEIDALYKKKMDEFVIGQRERKHAIAQILNEIVPTIELLKQYSENENSFNWNSVVSPRSGKTFGDNMLALQGLMQRVVSMVDNFTNMEKFHPAQKILVDEFISNYCKSKVSPLYKTLIESRLSEPTKVSISHEELTQMLDNLFTNANKYGFTDTERKDYVLKVILEDADTVFPMVAIRILNNGNPASDSISPEKIFVWGEGKGSGIGCWQVKEIAEYFGGSVRFIDRSKEPREFATEFEICLPIII